MSRDPPIKTFVYRHHHYHTTHQPKRAHKNPLKRLWFLSENNASTFISTTKVSAVQSLIFFYKKSALKKGISWLYLQIFSLFLKSVDFNFFQIYVYPHIYISKSSFMPIIIRYRFLQCTGSRVVAAPVYGESCKRWSQVKADHEKVRHKLTISFFCFLPSRQKQYCFV